MSDSKSVAEKYKSFADLSKIVVFSANVASKTPVGKELRIKLK